MTEFKKFPEPECYKINDKNKVIIYFYTKDEVDECLKQWCEQLENILDNKFGKPTNLEYIGKQILARELLEALPK